MNSDPPQVPRHHPGDRCPAGGLAPSGTAGVHPGSRWPPRPRPATAAARDARSAGRCPELCSHPASRVVPETSLPVCTGAGTRGPRADPGRGGPCPDPGGLGVEKGPLVYRPVHARFQGRSPSCCIGDAPSAAAFNFGQKISAGLERGLTMGCPHVTRSHTPCQGRGPPYAAERQRELGSLPSHSKNGGKLTSPSFLPSPPPGVALRLERSVEQSTPPPRPL